MKNPVKATTREPVPPERCAHPRSAVFIMSAARFTDLPPPSGDEFCIVGRSNVGKSSFINHVLENGALARVSKRPGKTDCANLFRLTESMVWVDLPGYGYARKSRSEKKRWSELIDDYCSKRENVRGVFWLVDIRNIGLETDRAAYLWLTRCGVPVFPVLTKCDKVGQGELRERIAVFNRTFSCGEQPVVYSVKSSRYRERFWERFNAWRPSGE
jgi:GTP-binding protein